MPRGDFFGIERCENGHQDAPDKNERLCDPVYAKPAVRDDDYLVSEARYGRPVDVWKSSIERGRRFTFDLGANRSSEREGWRTYSPATEHELRTQANTRARKALLRWFWEPESPRACEAFIEVARGSVQFRRLMLRYGLDGSEPMKLEDVAKAERVARATVEQAISAAVRSLPVLPTRVEHAGLRSISVQTVKLAEEAKFMNINELDDAGSSADYVTGTINTKHGNAMAQEELDSVHELAEELGGMEAEALVSGLQSNWRGPGEWDLAHAQDAVRSRHDFGTVIEVYKNGTSWASDASGRSSLMDAYTDGWAACFDGAEQYICPFRNRKLRKKWHEGYREAAQELAARREADLSTS